MTKVSNLDKVNRQRQAGNIFRRILGAHCIHYAFDEREIQIRQQVIVENTGNKNKLSNAIVDHMFPKEQSSSELLHYTSLFGLRGISTSGELRLYALRKRIDEDELQTFVRKHGLRGYLDSSQGEPYYKELSNDIFYCSFTSPNQKNIAEMWSAFADGGKGVRLKMHLKPYAADLRSIQYENPSRTLLNELNDELVHAMGVPFMPWSISRIGSFYLSSNYDYETEVRLMIKRHKGIKSFARNDGSYEYWPVPIGKHNPFCRVDVTEILVGPSADEPDVRAAVAGTPLEGVPTVKAAK